MGEKIKRNKSEIILEETEEEIDFRSISDLTIENKCHLKCSKCSKVLGYDEKKRNINVHPVLKVLFCKSCEKFYGNGEFSLDEDGDEKYCRWCGEGGTLFLCSKCVCGFCPKCIKRNLSISFLKRVKSDDNWICFICNSKPLWKSRLIAAQALKICKERKSGKKSESKQVDLNSSKRESIGCDSVDSESSSSKVKDDTDKNDSDDQENRKSRSKAKYDSDDQENRKSRSKAKDDSDDQENRKSRSKAKDDSDDQENRKSRSKVKDVNDDQENSKSRSKKKRQREKELTVESKSENENENDVSGTPKDNQSEDNNDDGPPVKLKRKKSNSDEEGGNDGNSAKTLADLKGLYHATAASAGIISYISEKRLKKISTEGIVGCKSKIKKLCGQMKPILLGLDEKLKKMQSELK